MDYNRQIIAEFKQFEADIDIARRFNAKAVQIFRSI